MTSATRVCEAGVANSTLSKSMSTSFGSKEYLRCGCLISNRHNQNRILSNHTHPSTNRLQTPFIAVRAIGIGIQPLCRDNDGQFLEQHERSPPFSTGELYAADVVSVGVIRECNVEDNR